MSIIFIYTSPEKPIDCRCLGFWQIIGWGDSLKNSTYWELPGCQATDVGMPNTIKEREGEREDNSSANMVIRYHSLFMYMAMIRFGIRDKRKLEGRIGDIWSLVQRTVLDQIFYSCFFIGCRAKQNRNIRCSSTKTVYLIQKLTVCIEWFHFLCLGTCAVPHHLQIWVIYLELLIVNYFVRLHYGQLNIFFCFQDLQNLDHDWSCRNVLWLEQHLVELSCKC